MHHIRAYVAAIPYAAIDACFALDSSLHTVGFDSAFIQAIYPYAIAYHVRLLDVGCHDCLPLKYARLILCAKFMWIYVPMHPLPTATLGLYT